jgi:hypothetical protein
MRRVPLLSFLLLASLPPSFLSAQGQFGTQGTVETCVPLRAPPRNELFEGVEYRAGVGFPDKFKGTLYLTADSLILGQDCAADATLKRVSSSGFRNTGRRFGLRISASFKSARDRR